MERIWKAPAVWIAIVVLRAGRLLVCSIDLDQRPAARQLRRSLLSYIGGNAFNPSTPMTLDAIQSLLFKTHKESP